MHHMVRKHLFASALPAVRMTIYDLVALGLVSMQSLTVPQLFLYAAQRASVLCEID